MAQLAISDITVGKTVYHQRFGEGTVLSINDKGAAEIDFKEVGKKAVLLKFAQLFDAPIIDAEPPKANEQLPQKKQPPPKKETKPKPGTILYKVIAAQDDLKKMTSHTELRTWAISNGMDNRSAFPKFKDALNEIGMDYEAIRSGVRQQQQEKLEQAVTHEVTLYSDAKASQDRFGITDKDGNVVWYGKFFDNDSDYDGEQSSGELAAAKKAVWLTSKIMESIGANAIELHLYVDAQWLTYQDHPGQKGFALTQLARKYNIDLHVHWIPGADNPADEWTTASGYKKWSDNNLRLLADIKQGKEEKAAELVPKEIEKPKQNITKIKAVLVHGFFREFDKSFGMRVQVYENQSEQQVGRMLFFPKKLVLEKTDKAIVVPEWIYRKKIEELKEELAVGPFSARSMEVQVDAEPIWIEKEKKLVELVEKTDVDTTNPVTEVAETFVITEKEKPKPKFTRFSALTRIEKAKNADDYIESIKHGLNHYNYHEIILAAKDFENQFRSEYVREMDKKKDSKNRLTPTPENLLRWMKNPGKFDLIGIDNFEKTDPTADLKIKREVFWHKLGIRTLAR